MVYREFFETRQASSSAENQVAPAKKFRENWKELLAAGERIGPADAPVTLVEFGDFECPACKAFHETVSQVSARMGDSIALIYIHYPLPMHRFAIPSANAAECAREQGRFAEMSNLLYAKQDSLGLIPFVDLARRAGVARMTDFELCTRSSRPNVRIDAGRSAGDSIQLRATPTFLVNGWEYVGALNSEHLRVAIDEALQKRQ